MRLNREAITNHEHDAVAKEHKDRRRMCDEQ